MQNIKFEREYKIDQCVIKVILNDCFVKDRTCMTCYSTVTISQINSFILSREQREKVLEEKNPEHSFMK